MRADERERCIEDLQLYRRDICAKIDALIVVLHCEDFEEEREALESEAAGLVENVHRLRQWRTQWERDEIAADDRVTEMRECRP